MTDDYSFHELSALEEERQRLNELKRSTLASLRAVAAEINARAGRTALEADLRALEAKHGVRAQVLQLQPDGILSEEAVNGG